MKIRSLLISIGIGIFVGIFVLSFKNDKKAIQYVPRTVFNTNNENISDAMQWLIKRRNNQITGKIDLKDIQNVQEQIKKLRLKSTHSLDLEWNELGPDNVGGRTRTILFDKDDPNLLFAGSVGGGLWKSTVGGSSWEKVSYSGDNLSNGFAALSVSTICQAANGDIYFGTGEGFYYNHGHDNGTPMFEGQGIWKSTDKGATWARLQSTWNDANAKAAFVTVLKLEADPTNAQTIYAATAKGLRVTTDGGTTWTNPLDASYADYNRKATDIEIGSNGNIVASVNNQAYIKKSGGTWTKVSDAAANGFESSSDKIPTDAGRLEFDISPVNPDYIYCGAAGSDEALYNVYQSTDGGSTWRIIGPGGSEDFNPYNEQGIYDNLVKASPVDENIVFIGGLDLWVWSDGTTWQQISYWSFPAYHPLYLHADQHDMAFHPNNPDYMYITSDGGITKLEGGAAGTGYHPINHNYNVTQFYSIAFDGDNRVLGGTQDNGTQYINFEGNTEMSSYRIMGGDGGYTAISQLNPKLLFFTSQYGRLKRTNDVESDPQFFYSDKLKEDHIWVVPETDAGSDPAQCTFVTPIALWETHIDSYSEDTIEFVAKKHYDAGEKLEFKSHNIYDMPLYHILEHDYEENDTIKTYDPYGSLFVLGMARQLWVTRMATNFNESTGRWGWWRMLPVDFLDYNSSTDLNAEMVEQIAISHDGDNIFFSTSRNKIYRVSNVQQARTRNNADMQYVSPNGNPPVTMDDKVIEVQQIEDFGSRAITDIYCDPQNIENVIVTLGNYGNTNYVYYSSNAVSTTSETGNFSTIQGDLPQFPVYTGLINWDNSTEAIVGTEYGVFACTNILAGSPTWTEENGGMENVPTFMIRQQTWPNWRPGINNHGYLFIGTHGRGMFNSSSLKGPVSVKETNEISENINNNIKVYPNPATVSTTIGYNIEYPGDVIVSVFDLQGKLIKSEKIFKPEAGYQTYSLNVDNLLPGSYFITVNKGSFKSTAKFVKY
ncbi:MAG: T9SS type A sorting domain-containing protein [Chlorobi bacterium]|nr:T9SS type A sorting domain-containing protein [Chlorobiota bacterium]